MTETSVPSEALPPLPEEAPVGPKTARWRWWIHLVLIGTYPWVGMTFRPERLTPGPVLSGDTRGLLFVSSLEIAVFAVVFGLGWLASRATREELLFCWRPGWWVVPLGIFYSVAIRFALGVVVIVVTAFLVTTQVSTPETVKEFVTENRPEVETLVSVPAMQSNPSYYWLTLTLVSFVVAGLREEVWRAGTLAGLGALYPRTFASPRGRYLAVTLSAVLFGAMHLYMGIIAVALAAIIGLLLGLIMIHHKSIWPAVIAHGSFDATTMALLPWAMEKIQHLR